MGPMAEGGISLGRQRAKLYNRSRNRVRRWARELVSRRGVRRESKGRRPRALRICNGRAATKIIRSGGLGLHCSPSVPQTPGGRVQGAAAQGGGPTPQLREKALEPPTAGEAGGGDDEGVGGTRESAPPNSWRWLRQPGAGSWARETGAAESQSTEAGTAGSGMRRRSTFVSCPPQRAVGAAHTLEWSRTSPVPAGTQQRRGPGVAPR